METILLGGINTARLTIKELTDQMVCDCMAARQDRRSLPKLVFASNGSVIAAYHNDFGYQMLINSADIIDADGMPLVLLSRLLKNPLPERIATTDFIHHACDAAVAHDLRFFFLGGRKEDNARAIGFFRNKYPGLQLVGEHGYFNPSDECQICERLRQEEIDVLWLGLGSPLQEGFAVRNRNRLRGIGWVRTCGGMVDYYSGRSKRAPRWMQNAGLEWLFRAAHEPRRLGGRYVRTNLPALYHILTKSSGRLNAV